jgi:uroporphyrinogen-III decarboxylase
MSVTTAKTFLPIELVLNPNWWHRTAGISFDESFYLDSQVRIKNDMLMRRILYQRFGDLGLGEFNPKPRPIIGSRHVVGGFVIPALLRARIRFAPDAAPQAEPLNLSSKQIDALQVLDFKSTWPVDQIVADIDSLENEFGYLVGDLNTDGLLNAAYTLYGEDLYVDFYAAPARVRRLLEIIAELIVDVAEYIRQRTGTCSIAVNRMVKHVDRAMFYHANCSVQMISPQSYRQIQLPVEQKMVARIQPYGIHHCGDNLHLIAPIYAGLPARMCGIGWGSDVARCRNALPDAFFNLRLSPVRMLQCTPAEIARDTEDLLLNSGPLEQAGVCCINMDYGTPDENIFAMFEVVQRYRCCGA